MDFKPDTFYLPALDRFKNLVSVEVTTTAIGVLAHELAEFVDIHAEDIISKQLGGDAIVLTPGPHFSYVCPNCLRQSARLAFVGIT